MAALYNTGYVRLVPYGLTYGTSFILGPAYWEDTGTGERYFHDLQISRIDIDTSNIDPVTDLGPVYMTVYARDYQEGYWPAYHLNLKYYLLLQDYAPNDIEMLVQQYYTVENAFNLSLVRQTNHEGFKWVQFSSMYMDNNFHDSDGIQYPVQGGEIVSADFPAIRCGTIIFSSPKPLSADNPWIQVSHNDDLGWQNNTPTTLVFITPEATPAINVRNSLPIVPQGYITCSSDENNDNVGIWLNDESAPSSFIHGQTGFIGYSLNAQDDPRNVHVYISGNLKISQTVSHMVRVQECHRGRTRRRS